MNDAYVSDSSCERVRKEINHKYNFQGQIIIIFFETRKINNKENDWNTYIEKLPHSNIFISFSNEYEK